MDACATAWFLSAAPAAHPSARVLYHQRAQRACGRDSRIAPAPPAARQRTGPPHPVHTLPSENTTRPPPAATSTPSRRRLRPAAPSQPASAPMSPEEEHQRVQTQYQQSCHRDRREDPRPPRFARLPPSRRLQLQEQLDAAPVEHQRGSDAKKYCSRGEFELLARRRTRPPRLARRSSPRPPRNATWWIRSPARVDIARVPPPARQAGVGAVPDPPHEGSRDEEGQDEGKQAAQQRQAATVDDVVREPVQSRPARTSGTP